MYGADIYLRPDTSYVRSGNEDLMPAVTLLIYGTTYALTILLPTDDIASVTRERVDSWIEIVHGPLTSQCEGTQAQFELLLDVVLIYRAFALKHDGLKPKDFIVFADRLIRTAVELHPFERADDELAEFVGWLHVNFPETIFQTNGLDLSNLPMQSPLEPPRRFRPPVAQTLARAGYALANDLQQLSLTESKQPVKDNNAATPTPATETIRVTLPKHDHAAAAKMHHRGKRAPRPAPSAAGVDLGSESGEDSDRAPSLLTVTCSSCGGSDREASDDDDEVVWSDSEDGSDGGDQ